MTDNELIEMAAKAIGLKLIHMPLSGFSILEGENIGHSWNPLLDDGDALRLAIDLGIDFVHRPRLQYVTAHVIGYSVNEGGSDRYAAARRAIVHVAAHIGKCR